MRIFISGDGESGTYMATLLSSENQDVILMGNNETKLSNLDSRYNIITTEGNPLSITDLRRAGVETADLFVAVNKRTPVNLTACQLARLAGAGESVARIDAEELMRSPSVEFMKQTGVDTMVFPEYLAVDEIRMALKANWAKSWFEICGGRLTLTGVRISDSSPLKGLTLRDLASTERKFHVAAIKRGRDTLIPRGNDTLIVGDTVYLTTTPEQLPELPSLCGAVNNRVRSIMIAGGDKFPHILASALAKEYDVTVIEPDTDLCRRIAETTEGVTVVNGDYRNLDVLREENLAYMDAFLAFSGSTESNIVSSMVAREFGVKTIIAEIEDIQYIAEAESLNIDHIINKKLITASHVLRLVLSREIDTPRLMSLESAGVVEIVVKEGAKVTEAPVKDLKISRNLTIAGIIRNDHGHLVDGFTRICGGDHVVVVCRNGHFKDIDDLFRSR